MSGLVWDRVGERTYESGLDRGVLYLPDGSAVPWNGLTSVIEKFNIESSSIYYDGMKISELVTLGDFEATAKAVTYPDELTDLEGFVSVKPGLFYAYQTPQAFALCYRTRIGNDLDGDSAAYKIHIVYNVIAIPSDTTYATVSDDPSLVEFEWTLKAVPEDVPGFRPTSQIIIDSRIIDPWLLEEIEIMLYGDMVTNAVLIPMSEMITYISDWFRVKIVDNGDGTWTATEHREGFISFGINDFFQITGVKAIYLDEDTFEISDTLSKSDVPQLKIVDNGDGTWQANTDEDNIIVMITEDQFEIRNAHAEFLNPYTYRIDDTTD